VVAGATSTDLMPLLEMSRAAGWPVLAEPASNIRVRGTISSYDALLRADRFTAAHRPDVVLRVGKLSLGRPLARLLRDTRQVAIAPPGTWWDESRNIEAMHVADPAALCSRVTEQLDERTETGWARSWRAHDDVARRVLDEVLDSTDAPTEPRAARDLAAALPEGAGLFVGSSMPVRDLDSFMVPRTGITVHANRGANGIDGATSTALGIAAATGAKTAALMGDLSLLHDSNGMLYEAKDDLDLTLVVVNNDGGGIFSFLEQAGVVGFERVFATPHGRDLATWAQLYGIPYTKIETAPELGEIAGSNTGLRLIEVRTDREENVKTHRTIWQNVENALGSVR
jgi:2-succinyl-5-enolpyruvyl-6-hydroxy-3-cyclohexene-1-carboxylate synthase